jgi:hypothetical protein
MATAAPPGAGVDGGGGVRRSVHRSDPAPTSTATGGAPMSVSRTSRGRPHPQTASGGEHNATVDVVNELHAGGCHKGCDGAPNAHSPPRSQQWPIRCIIYCEFDNIDGPRMYHQFPADVLHPDQFDAISKFIITDEVSGRVSEWVGE